MTDDDDEGVVVFRNGRRNNPRLNDMRRQKIDDFMLVSRHVDIWRNEECKKCKETNLRFDATRTSLPRAPVVREDARTTAR